MYVWWFSKSHLTHFSHIVLSKKNAFTHRLTLVILWRQQNHHHHTACVSSLHDILHFYRSLIFWSLSDKCLTSYALCENRPKNLIYTPTNHPKVTLHSAHHPPFMCYNAVTSKDFHSSLRSCDIWHIYMEIACCHNLVKQLLWFHLLLRKQASHIYKQHVLGARVLMCTNWIRFWICIHADSRTERFSTRCYALWKYLMTVLSNLVSLSELYPLCSMKSTCKIWPAASCHEYTEECTIRIHVITKTSIWIFNCSGVRFLCPSITPL